MRVAVLEKKMDEWKNNQVRIHIVISLWSRYSKKVSRKNIAVEFQLFKLQFTLGFETTWVFNSKKSNSHQVLWRKLTWDGERGDLTGHWEVQMRVRIMRGQRWRWWEKRRRHDTIVVCHTCSVHVEQHEVTAQNCMGLRRHCNSWRSTTTTTTSRGVNWNNNCYI